VQVSSDAVWRGWHVRLCRTREKRVQRSQQTRA